MLSILKQQQPNILKQRDTLLQQLESKYVSYIHSLLQQKILISTTITKHYDKITNKIENSICNHLNMYIIQNNTINPNKPNHSNSLKMLLFFKQKQILKKKEISIHQLELKYSNYIRFLLHQKICISTTIIKQYDEMAKTNNHINSNISLPLSKSNIIPLQIKNESNEPFAAVSTNNNNVENIIKQNKCLRKIVAKIKSKKTKSIHPALNVYISKINLKCQQCDILFNNLKHFETHMKIKHNNPIPYKCLYDNCGKGYSFRGSLIGHIRVKHIKQTQYECNICHKLFNKNSARKRHIISHKKNNYPELCLYVPKVNLNCNQCNQLFNSNKDFENHMQNIHSISLPYKCLYDNCDKQYSIKKDLISHIRVDHSEKANYKCTLCHKLFWDKAGLKKHLPIHNKQDTSQNILPALYIYVPKINLKCIQQCDILFNTVADFKTHMKCKHSNIRPYKCLDDNCDKDYKVKKDLLNHIRLNHIGIYTKHKCNVCHRLFQNTSKYKRHISKCGVDTSPKVHPALYVYIPKINLKCEQCDELFNSCKNFQNHMKDKHNISAPYKCLYDNCNNYYRRRAVLIGHISVKHIKKAKFECDVCKKLFWVEQNWRVHIAIHKEERRFKCNQCLGAFKTRYALNGHVKQVHNKGNKIKSNQSQITSSNMDVPMLEPNI